MGDVTNMIHPWWMHTPVYTSWHRRFAVLPHRCRISKKIIWFKMGWMGRYIDYTQYIPEPDETWHNEKDHLLWILTN